MLVLNTKITNVLASNWTSSDQPKRQSIFDIDSGILFDIDSDLLPGIDSDINIGHGF